MSIVQRLYPTPTQTSVLLMHCAHARFVYNLALEQRKYWTRSTSVRINRGTQQKELAQLRSEYDWLRAGSSAVQQGALRDIETAYVNFFRKTAAYPQYKTKRSKQSFLVRDLKIKRINRRNGLILIPKLGYVRFRLSRAWNELSRASSARVTFKNDQWHVSFTSIPQTKITSSSPRLIGIDRGCANTLATSDGNMFHIPELKPGEQQRFLKLQQKLARQSKGSNRRKQTLKQLSVLYRRLGDRKRNWIEQTTTMIAKNYDASVLEKLTVSNMVRKPKPKPNPNKPGTYLPNNAHAKAALNKAIYTSCWGKFATRLEHKTTVQYVNPRFTSQQCHQCGHIEKDNRKSQAIFLCTYCGHTNHADTNAALNILHKHLHPGTQGQRAPQNANHLAA